MAGQESNAPQPYKLVGRTVCRTENGDELFTVERVVNRNMWGALSPTETDALTRWIVDAMNAPSFDLATIHRAHMDRAK